MSYTFLIRNLKYCFDSTLARRTRHLWISLEYGGGEKAESIAFEPESTQL